MTGLPWGIRAGEAPGLGYPADVIDIHNGTRTQVRIVRKTNAQGFGELCFDEDGNAYRKNPHGFGLVPAPDAEIPT